MSDTRDGGATRGFNLLQSAFLPARRSENEITLIRPFEIVGAVPQSNRPFNALAPVRPDFAGALYELLIGLLQTCYAPDGEDEWLSRWETPPSPSELRAAMEPFEDAFELDGDGPRFMQDHEKLDSDAVPVAQLLIEAPGAKTQRENTDHFVKRNAAEALCRACAATALYTLQTYAPTGGAGHRTSLRGGGPLTTLVVANRPEEAEPSLWERLWPNVLPRSAIGNAHDSGSADRALIFPWLASTRVSGKQGKPTFAEDMHPLHVYWGMPRRIRLDFTAAEGDGCDLCSRADEVLVRSYRTRPHGMDYQGPWKHPLSPYVTRKEDVLPVHPGPGGISYRHWLGLTASHDVGGREAARVIGHFRDEREPWLGDVRSRFTAFGYDMDNMKARAWHESLMPLLALPRGEDGRPAEELVIRLEDNVRMLLAAAEDVAKAVRGSIIRALFDRTKNVKGDFGFIGERFWRDTEAVFFATLERIRTSIEPDHGDRTPEVERRDWLHALARAGLAIFDDLVDTEGLADTDFERVVEARGFLSRYLRSKRFKEILALPEEARETTRTKTREEVTS